MVSTSWKCKCWVTFSSVFYATIWGTHFFSSFYCNKFKQQKNWLLLPAIFIALCGHTRAHSRLSSCGECVKFLVRSCLICPSGESVCVFLSVSPGRLCWQEEQIYCGCPTSQLTLAACGGSDTLYIRVLARALQWAARGDCEQVNVLISPCCTEKRIQCLNRIMNKQEKNKTVSFCGTLFYQTFWTNNSTKLLLLIRPICCDAWPRLLLIPIWI